jgi:hypothetical protein
MRAAFAVAWLPIGAACSNAPAPVVGASGDEAAPEGGTTGIFVATEAGHLDPDAALGLACVDASPGFTATIAPVFAGCGGGELCHGFDAPPALYRQLVDAPATDGCGGTVVVPGSLEQSYLLRKLTGVGMCPNTGVMPPGGKLPPAEIQAIADWICAGAPND